MSKIFIGDRLCEGTSVSVSALGRGFAFGFGVFETIKFLERCPCFWETHFARFQKAILAAGFDYELDLEELLAKSIQLFEAESVDSGIFKIVFCDDLPEPQVLMFVRSRGLDESVEPLNLVGSDVVKASRAFTSRYKSLNYMESMLALEKAQRKGFGECVFRNEHSHLTECAVANLFWVKGGVLKTPDLECGLLDGIVREKILGIAKREGLPIEVGQFGEADLLAADEVFLTSSGKGPRSVKSYLSLRGEEKRYTGDLIEKLRSDFREIEYDSIRKVT